MFKQHIGVIEFFLQISIAVGVKKHIYYHKKIGSMGMKEGQDWYLSPEVQFQLDETA